jgi:hypothetical protein
MALLGPSYLVEVNAYYMQWGEDVMMSQHPLVIRIYGLIKSTAPWMAGAVRHDVKPMNTDIVYIRVHYGPLVLR